MPNDKIVSDTAHNDDKNNYNQNQNESTDVYNLTDQPRSYRTFIIIPKNTLQLYEKTAFWNVIASALNIS